MEEALSKQAASPSRAQKTLPASVAQAENKTLVHLEFHHANKMQIRRKGSLQETQAMAQVQKQMNALAEMYLLR